MCVQSADMLPELLAQQAFKQETDDASMRMPDMGCVHIGGEELLFGGGSSSANAASGTIDGGATGFANMFDD
jgi:hypothetical protein